MTKKKETEKKEESKKKESPKEDSKFDLEESLSQVNRFLLPGFRDYIADKEVKNQKQFDKYYKEYGAMK